MEKKQGGKDFITGGCEIRKSREKRTKWLN